MIMTIMIIITFFIKILRVYDSHDCQRTYTHSFNLQNTYTRILTYTQLRAYVYMYTCF